MTVVPAPRKARSLLFSRNRQGRTPEQRGQLCRFDCHPEAESHDNIEVLKSKVMLDGELVAVWYASNGADVVLATYESQRAGSRETTDELKEAEAVIGSLKF